MEGYSHPREVGGHLSRSVGSCHREFGCFLGCRKMLNTGFTESSVTEGTERTQD